jgi:hypothetical protein
VEAAVLDSCVTGGAAGADDGAVAETVEDPDLRGAVDAEVLGPIGGMDEMLLICIDSPLVFGLTFLRSFVGSFSKTFSLISPGGNFSRDGNARFEKSAQMTLYCSPPHSPIA